MQNILKSAGILLLVFFVLSITGAAATCNSNFCKMDAKNDVFNLNPCKNVRCFNVLANDFGTGKKVTTTGVIITSQGGKVNMRSNGVFCYTQPVACSKGSDTFSYTAVNKYGIKDTAKVTLKFKCTGCSSCASGKCTCATCKNCVGGSCTKGKCSTCA